MSGGLCMCGADDCPRCFPNHFYKGRYIDPSLTDEEYEKFKDDVDDDELEEKLSKLKLEEDL